MDSELITILAQFGAAGLIGFLWIAERRHNATREQQLTEAHQKVVKQDRDLEALLTVIKDNTRAIQSLEQTQRDLVTAVRVVRKS